MNFGTPVLIVAFAYLGLLFGIAYYGDKAAGAGRNPIATPYIYALTLTMYVSGASYFGAVRGRLRRTFAGGTGVRLHARRTRGLHHGQHRHRPDRRPAGGQRCAARRRNRQSPRRTEWRACIDVFDPGLRDRTKALFDLEAMLRQSVLSGDNFEVHYQPIVRLETGRLPGFEALVRMRRPDGSLVSPADFIPLTEETG